MNPPRRPELRSLTGLRFVAALPVVLFHLLPRAAMGPEAARLADLGYLSVGLFFVLSGFVLSYAYSDGVPSRGRFYRARFARVYPVYAAAMLVALPAFASDFRRIGLRAWEFPIDVALRFGMVHAWHPGTTKYYNVPSWSLSCEAFFYLLFPLVLPSILRMSAREVPRSLVLVTGLAAFIPFLFEWAYPGSLPATDTYRVNLVKFHPLVRLPEFLVGCLLGRLFVSGGADGLRRHAGKLVIGGCVFIAAMVVGGAPYLVSHTGGLTAAFVAILLGLALGDSERGLGSWPMRMLGDASYALYILHVPLFRIWRDYGISRGWPVDTLGYAAVAVGGLIALSIAVNRGFEVPMRQWIRGRAKPQTGDVPVAPPG